MATASGTSFLDHMQQRLSEWLSNKKDDVCQTLFSALTRQSTSGAAALEARQNLFLFQKLAHNPRLAPPQLRTGFQNILDTVCQTRQQRHPQRFYSRPEAVSSSSKSPTASLSITSSNISFPVASAIDVLPVNSNNVPQIENSDQFQDAILHCARYGVSLSSFFECSQQHQKCLQSLSDELFLHLSTMKSLLSALSAAATLSKIIATISQQLVEVMARIDADLFSLAMCDRDLRRTTGDHTVAAFVKVRHHAFSSEFRQLLRATVIAYRLAQQRPLHHSDVLRLLCVAFAHQYLYSVGYQVGQTETTENVNQRDCVCDDKKENDVENAMNDENKNDDNDENEQQEDMEQQHNMNIIMDTRVRQAMTAWVNSAKDSLRPDYGLEWCLACLATSTSENNIGTRMDGIDADVSQLVMHFLKRPFAASLPGIHTAVVLSFCLILMKFKLKEPNDTHEIIDLMEMTATNEMKEMTATNEMKDTNDVKDEKNVEEKMCPPIMTISFSNTSSSSLSSMPPSSWSPVSTPASLQYVVHSFDGSSLPSTICRSIEKLCTEKYQNCEPPEFRHGFCYWIAMGATGTMDLLACMRTHSKSYKREKYWTMMYSGFRENHKPAVKTIIQTIQQHARTQHVDLYVLVNVADITEIRFYSDCGFVVEDEQNDQWLQMHWFHASAE